MQYYSHRQNFATGIFSHSTPLDSRTPIRIRLTLRTPGNRDAAGLVRWGLEAGEEWLWSGCAAVSDRSGTSPGENRTLHLFFPLREIFNLAGSTPEALMRSTTFDVLALASAWNCMARVLMRGRKVASTSKALPLDLGVFSRSPQWLGSGFIRLAPGVVVR